MGGEEEVVMERAARGHGCRQAPQENIDRYLPVCYTPFGDSYQCNTLIDGGTHDVRFLGPETQKR